MRDDCLPRKLDHSEVIEDLTNTLRLSNSPWNAWELEFIESLEGKELDTLSVRQRDKALELWEKL